MTNSINSAHIFGSEKAMSFSILAITSSLVGGSSPPLDPLSSDFLYVPGRMVGKVGGGATVAVFVAVPVTLVGIRLLVIVVATFPGDVDLLRLRYLRSLFGLAST